jgi:hypothetical protein
MFHIIHLTTEIHRVKANMSDTRLLPVRLSLAPAEIVDYLDGIGWLLR